MCSLKGDAEVCEEVFWWQVRGGLGGARCEWPPLAEVVRAAAAR